MGRRSRPGSWSAGTFIRLNPDTKPNSFHAASDPCDVARVEDRTYICSQNEHDAGFTNNWKSPADMKAIMTDLYQGCMTGRTMYVIPFVMGHIEADVPMYGVEITDSAYVVVSMKIMARIGATVLAAIEGQPRRRRRQGPALGRLPADRRRRDVAWPCSDTKYIAHFPETREIWSLRLRLRRQRPARQEVLRAAHRQRDGRATTAGWPSTCSSSSSPPRPARCTTSPARSRAPAARPTSR